MLPIKRGGELEVVGWVLNPRREVPREFAVVLVGVASSYAARGAAGGARADVARVFSTALAIASGYSVRATLANVEPGEYEVILVQDTYNVPTRCETGWRIQVVD
ncbi:hypothetical protein [Coralloluteibacterium thermophilus]|uniref:Head-tail adaptor protein n=1 Tax=Coralloluteibacterium thermophilum TaxID=2707049 RepID=A0ABV9NEN0_9GAMM